MDMGGMAGMGMGGDSNSTSSSSDSSMSMSGGMMMMMNFHAGGGDNLWSSSFSPTTAPGIWGACVLLFFIALASRWLHAMERSLIAYWHDEAFKKLDQTGAATVNAQRFRSNPPWTPSCDIPRGLFQVVHGGILYLLMLAVMTMNVYYFAAILIGLGTGESAFGRFARRRWNPAPLPDRQSADGKYDSGLLHESVEKEIE